MYYSKIEPTFSIRIVSLGWVIGVDKYSPGVHAIPTVKIAIETLKRAGLVDLFIAVVIASCVHTHTHIHTCVRAPCDKYFFPSFLSHFETRLYLQHGDEVFFPLRRSIVFLSIRFSKGRSFDRRPIDISKRVYIIYEKKLWNTVVFAWAWN